MGYRGVRQNSPWYRGVNGAVPVPVNVMEVKPLLVNARLAPTGRVSVSTATAPSRNVTITDPPVGPLSNDIVPDTNVLTGFVLSA
jgi:hypothetical protein